MAAITSHRVKTSINWRGWSPRKNGKGTPKKGSGGLIFDYLFLEKVKYGVWHCSLILPISRDFLTWTGVYLTCVLRLAAHGGWGRLSVPLTCCKCAKRFNSRHSRANVRLCRSPSQQKALLYRSTTQDSSSNASLSAVDQRQRPRGDREVEMTSESSPNIGSGEVCDAWLTLSHPVPFFPCLKDLNLNDDFNPSTLAHSSNRSRIVRVLLPNRYHICPSSISSMVSNFYPKGCLIRE